MKIQWLRHWVRKPTLGIWAYQNRGDTTQKQAIVQFCADHNVHDLWVGSSNPDSYHDMISLVIKQEKFISTREIDSL
mgnify:CR=1 FL=1